MIWNEWVLACRSHIAAFAELVGEIESEVFVGLGSFGDGGFGDGRFGDGSFGGVLLLDEEEVDFTGVVEAEDIGVVTGAVVEFVFEVDGSSSMLGVSIDGVACASVVDVTAVVLVFLCAACDRTLLK